MTIGGLLMMILSYTTVTGLFLFCVTRVLMDPKPLDENGDEK